MERFIRYFILTCMVILLIVGGFNYYHDPYGYFRIHGLRAHSELGNNVWGEDRNTKPISLLSQSPETIITGSSRVRLGFNTDDSNLTSITGPIYNLGINLSVFEDIHPHVLANLNPSVKTLIIGLELGQFTRNTENAPLAPHDNYIPIPHFLLGAHHLGIALWSVPTLKLSRESRKDEYTLTLSGFGNYHIKKRFVAKHGYRTLTQRIEKRTSNFSKHGNWDYYPQRMALFEDVVAKACSQQKEIKLFTSPLHVRQYVINHLLEIDDLFIDWKKEIVGLADKYTQQGCSISFTDFARINDITIAPFLPISDTDSIMEHYWESSHYKENLGLMVIKKLYEDPSIPNDFGIKLTKDNITLEMQHAQQELDDYINNNPDIVEELKVVISSGK